MTSPNPAPAMSPPIGVALPPIAATMAPYPTNPRRLNATQDAPITHAWSIGTTKVAQDRPAPRRKEECPPEVYIG